jgi:hypothetical protein
MKIQTVTFLIALLLVGCYSTIINSVKSTMNLDINFNNETPSCFIQTEMKSKNKVRSLIMSNHKAEPYVDNLPNELRDNDSGDDGFDDDDSFHYENVDMALSEDSTAGDDNNSSLYSASSYMVSTVLLALF